MSGLFGVKTGVLGTPGNLPPGDGSLFRALADRTNDAYDDALFGKWHITSPQDADAPAQHGVDYYDGFLGSNPETYDSWSRTVNGTTTTSSAYITSALTDGALAWIGERPADRPWFLWLAHAAPHGPYHVPPAGTFTVGNTNGRVNQYTAMIESLDFEVGRLLSGLDAATRANTLVIFVGDNGTPGNVIKDYPSDHGKATLYQGGVRVPMIVSGAGVSRVGERETALVHLTDLYATILEAAAGTPTGTIGNSRSLYALFGNGATDFPREFNYTEIQDANARGWAVRDNRYKLIQFDSGVQEFYDLETDSFEVNNLLVTALPTDLETRRLALVGAGTDVRDCVVNSVTGTDGFIQFSLSPSPATDWVDFLIDEELAGRTLRYRLVDANGRDVRRGLVTGERQSIGLGGLTAGLYRLQLLDERARPVGVRSLVVR